MTEHPTNELDDGITPAESFQPFAIYDRDGESIEFFLSNESFKGAFLDDHVTAYIGRDTNQVVGGLLSGVGKMIQDRLVAREKLVNQ